MKAVIVGCGRMGQGLARELEFRGHDVVVVDRDPGAFEELGPAFKGRAVVGDGFDRAVLLKAGVERADGLAALVATDEANVVVARVAREVFRVPRVVARVYDPKKAEIYRRLGLQTIEPVTWGVRTAADLLTYSQLGEVASLGSGEVEVVQVEVPSHLAGRPVTTIEEVGAVRAVALARRGRTTLAGAQMVLEMGDTLYVALPAGGGERLRVLLGLD